MEGGERMKGGGGRGENERGWREGEMKKRGEDEREGIG